LAATQRDPGLPIARVQDRQQASEKGPQQLAVALDLAPVWMLRKVEHNPVCAQVSRETIKKEKGGKPHSLNRTE
jgi:hypothetical protein